MNFGYGILWLLCYVTIGFFVGTFFNDALSTNLGNTDWADLIVYMWMFFWPFFLMFKFLFWMCIIGGSCFLAFLIFDFAKNR